MQGPDTEYDIEVDHIIPQSLFKESSIENKDFVQHNLLNLGLLPKDENISKGIEILEKEIIKTGINVDDILTDSFLTKVSEKLKFKSKDECFENIGFGSLSPKKVINKLVEEYNAKNGIKNDKENSEEIITKKNNKENIEGVEVEGIDNCLVKYAGCCNPLPGDEIVRIYYIWKRSFYS